MVELGESLNKLLNGLEDLGMDATIPQDMEMDLRHAMDLVDISDAASSLAVSSPRHNYCPSLLRINQLSPGARRKDFFINKFKDYTNEENDADDDTTDEFISQNSPYRSFLQEECDRQVAQLLQGGLFKSGSKNPILDNIADDEDTDADVDDVIDEEEISNFVDFLQFATGGDFRDCVEGVSKDNQPFYQLASLASAATETLSEVPSVIEGKGIDKNNLHDTYQGHDAFSMLPVELALQESEYDDKGYQHKYEVSDMERLFLSTPTFLCKTTDNKKSSNNYESSIFETASFKQ